MSADLPRLPGESPCVFIHGAEGWVVCDVHGWTGPKTQRARVLVCPDASEAVLPRLLAVVDAARGWAVDDDPECQCSLCLSLAALDKLDAGSPTP